MPRQRRSQVVSSGDNKSNMDQSANSSSSNGSNPPKPSKATGGILSYWKHFIGFTCFAIAVGVGYMGYLETRVNTPYDEKKVKILLPKYLLKYQYTIIILDGNEKRT